MRRICAHLALGTWAALAGAGCIDFESAHNSFCNQAVRDRRIDVCGRTFSHDTSRFGGAIYTSHVFSAEGSAHPTSVVIFPSSTHAVAGRLEGSADFGTGTLTSAGQGDIFVARYGALGTSQWSRRFGGAGEDSAAAVVRADSGGTSSTGGTYLLGTFEGAELLLESTLRLQSPSASSAFVALFSKEGTVTSAKLLGGTSGARVTGRHLARVEADGRLFAVGSVSGGDLLVDDVTVPGGERETLWVVSLNGVLGHLWHASASGCDFSAADQVAVRSDGAVAYVTGRLEGAECALGTVKPLSGKTPGTYAFIAAFDTTQAGATPASVRILGQVPHDSRVSVALDVSANAYVVADLVEDGGAPVPTLFEEMLVSAQFEDVYAPVALHAPSARSLGVTSNRTGRVWIHGTFDGDALSVGSLSATVVAGANTFVVEVDPTGAPQWARAFHSDEGIEGTAMAWDPSYPPLQPFTTSLDPVYGPDAVGPILAGWFRKQIDVELPHKYVPAPATGENLFLFRFYTPLDQQNQ